jgi:hypothetical protein
MGSFEMFLLLIFIFWILEGIAKARQKPRIDETGPDGAPSPKVPADRSQRPPSLLEVIAAELERAKEAQRQENQPRRPPELPSRPAEVPKQAMEASPPRPRAEVRKPSGIVQPTRRPIRGKSTVVPPTRLAARAKPKPGPRVDGDATEEQLAELDRGERTSTLWDAGLRSVDRGAAAEVERGKQTEAEGIATIEAKRAAVVEASRGTSLETSQRKPKLQRAAIKESQKALEAAPKQPSKASASTLEARHLIGASPAELRRILVLQEVLGPPVALRDDQR